MSVSREVVKEDELLHMSEALPWSLSRTLAYSKTTHVCTHLLRFFSSIHQFVMIQVNSSLLVIEFLCKANVARVIKFHSLFPALMLLLSQ